MARRQGGTLGGFTPLSTPNAPTDLSVSGGIGGATVSFTAPTDTGDGAVTSYIVTAIDESTGTSSGVTGTESPITISPGGGTFKIRAQAVNGFGPGRLTEFSTGNVIYSGTDLYAFGGNYNGELGLPDRANKSSPTQVGSLDSWLYVSSGTTFSLATKTNGTLWAWGRGTDGRTGLNVVTSRSSPTQVGALTNWYQVAAGYKVGSSVKTDGTLWTWGSGAGGALGIGLNNVNRSSPVQVGSDTDWLQVAVGTSGTLHAVKTNGTLWGWGYNFVGEIGDNTTVNKSSPVQIGALTTWAQVSTGGDFAGAVKTDGTLWAWGRNTRGQLGQNNQIYRSSPVQVGAATNWNSVSCGGSRLLATTTANQLYGIGENDAGQIGDGTTVDKSSPVQIGALTNWAAIETGSNSSTAVKTDGTLWTWGNNGSGRLGDGTTVNKSSPVQIGAETNWNVSSINGTHTLATTLVA